MQPVGAHFFLCIASSVFRHLFSQAALEYESDIVILSGVERERNGAEGSGKNLGHYKQFTFAARIRSFVFTPLSLRSTQDNSVTLMFLKKRNWTVTFSENGSGAWAVNSDGWDPVSLHPRPEGAWTAYSDTAPGGVPFRHGRAEKFLYFRKIFSEKRLSGPGPAKIYPPPKLEKGGAAGNLDTVSSIIYVTASTACKSRSKNFFTKSLQNIQKPLDNDFELSYYMPVTETGCTKHKKGERTQ
ncbi:MAG: hypothetical protein IK099_03770 [Clostridia bacterium]|nr:hypothetical protein [Clostridia bacterium]